MNKFEMVSYDDILSVLGKDTLSSYEILIRLIHKQYNTDKLTVQTFQEAARLNFPVRRTICKMKREGKLVCNFDLTVRAK